MSMYEHVMLGKDKIAGLGNPCPTEGQCALEFSPPPRLQQVLPTPLQEDETHYFWTVNIWCVCVVGEKPEIRTTQRNKTVPGDQQPEQK